MNGREWKVVDSREDNDQLNQSDAIAIFDISTVLEARMVRLRQTGPTWNSKYNFLYLRAFEIYGALLLYPD
jgi:hypothetical protein